MAMQKKGLIAITVQVCESTVENDCQTAVLTHFYLDKDAINTLQNCTKKISNLSTFISRTSFIFSQPAYVCKLWLL